MDRINLKDIAGEDKRDKCMNDARGTALGRTQTLTLHADTVGEGTVMLTVNSQLIAPSSVLWRDTYKGNKIV